MTILFRANIIMKKEKGSADGWQRRAGLSFALCRADSRHQQEASRAWDAVRRGFSRICRMEDIMSQDLERARRMLEGDYTCVVCRDDAVYTATERGVKPLLDWLDRGIDLTGFSAADRVVGRATAFLYCLLGVKEVYARIMSTPAAQVLRANGIKIAADQEVPGIINRRKTGPCPFENAVLHIDTPTEALAAIRQQMARMQAGA